MSGDERVRRWVDGELSASETDALRADALRDRDLARALADARDLAGRLREAARITAAAPPDELVERAVRRAIRMRAEHEAQPSPWWDWWVRPITLRVRAATIAVTAGVAIAGAVTGARTWRGHERADVPALAARAGAVAATHRENVLADRAGAAATPATDVAPAAVDTRRGAAATSASDVVHATAAARMTARETAATEVPVRFVLPARGAREVAVAGDFNHWHADASALRDDDGDGVFVGTLRLRPGTYAYMFVLDGTEWVKDPYATNFRDDGFGHQNAVLRID